MPSLHVYETFRSAVLEFGPDSEQGAKITLHKETASFFQPNH